MDEKLRVRDGKYKVFGMSSKIGAILPLPILPKN